MSKRTPKSRLSEQKREEPKSWPNTKGKWHAYVYGSKERVRTPYIAITDHISSRFRWTKIKLTMLVENTSKLLNGNAKLLNGNARWKAFVMIWFSVKLATLIKSKGECREWIK